ncbi:MAG: CDP-glucose 4,6-dehydratase [Sneathiella sp.]|jgi:CDP-glucose 4,6-dehydratase|uniref:CDP-glucose 4,6-dehydratase n=1 Tax=Sneathiella sp. TaxID=1964365 RepID=UPI000C588ADB|nr:CDP-glucose 4,6-dehydratase [Sneathiella sp.]MAL80458.1 CDP-glucose 4,6-dehydratase [Sneathiella sp.]
MTAAAVNPDFWNGRRVLLTGHTGFKGAWAALWLAKMGADVTGISLAPDGEFSLFGILQPRLSLTSHLLDIRDKGALANAVTEANPEIVLHMAAQALVRRSYREPEETFAVNVTGSINLMEALRDLEGLKAALMITSDKVYRNDDSGRAFVESDPLGGDDPYSASKAACEIAVASYAKSFFYDNNVPVATARAGNVIGGGDFSEDRLIPDIWRAARDGESVTLRYPGATRPWQHVLESVSGYLLYLQALAMDKGAGVPKALNFGPEKIENLTVGEIARDVQAAFGIPDDWSLEKAAQPPEKTHLALDASLARKTIGWRANWTAETALARTVDWYKAFNEGADMYDFTLSQITAYEARS